MTCTFFGHTYIREDFRPQLKAMLIDLIENHGVNKFYVGHNGAFDRAAYEILSELSASYDISYTVVLSRMPGKNDPYIRSLYPHTIFPDGIEKALPRFRIIYRNEWMIKNLTMLLPT